MKSKRRTIAWLTTAMTVAVLATLLWATGSVQAGPLAQVPLRITYQGLLTEAIEGEPGHRLEGNYDFRFEIFSAQSGGDPPLWSEQHDGVPVADGVFTVQLGEFTPLDPADFDGSIRWLEVSVRETAIGGSFIPLSPRQPLVSAAYAIGAGDADTLDGFQASDFQRRVSGSCDPAKAIRVINQDGTVTCEDVGSSTYLAGNQLSLVGTTFNVVEGAGSDLDADLLDGQHASAFASASHGHWGQTWTGSGTGLTLNSSDGTGVRGEGYNYGVYGTASGSSGTGVYGEAPLYGVYGHATGSGTADWGVLGEGDTDAGGVIGHSTASGVFAVRGSNADGIGGYFWNDNDSYWALYAWNEMGTQYPGLRVHGTSYFEGSKTGYVVDVCLNESEEALEQGDVVVISGYAPAVVGEIPVIKVRKASEAYDTGVVGVVDTRQAISAQGLSDAAAADPTATHAAPAGIRFVEGAVEQSDYLLVVTLGAFKAIKVDASYGAIQPGDLLATSPNPGHAMKATEPMFGTIIGKALGSLDSGTGIIPVFVTLH